MRLPAAAVLAALVSSCNVIPLNAPLTAGLQAVSLCFIYLRQMFQAVACPAPHQTLCRVTSALTVPSTADCLGAGPL
jgi:hypothetical protein